MGDYSPSAVAEQPRETFINAAFASVANASLDDLLSFLKVSHVARGSALARFYEAFPKTGPEPTGRDALITELRERATTGEVATDVTRGFVNQVLRLQNGLRDQEPSGP